MCDLHRRRSSSLYLIFVFTFVVCIHTTFAATPNASPNAALSPEIQGDLLMVHRSYAAAIEAYERESQPSAKLWNKIGVAYHHMFALEQARKYYQMALAMNPNFPEALNNLAAVYHGQHEYKQAERTYKLALKYSPGAAITYCNLGTAYFADEKYKQGMEAYRKALALNPNIFSLARRRLSRRRPRAGSWLPSIITWPKPTPRPGRCRKRLATCARRWTPDSMTASS